MLSENERPEESLVGTEIWLSRNLDNLDTTNKVSAKKSLRLKIRKQNETPIQHSYLLSKTFLLFTGSKCGREIDNGVVTVKWFVSPHRQGRETVRIPSGLDTGRRSQFEESPTFMPCNCHPTHTHTHTLFHPSHSPHGICQTVRALKHAL